MGSGAWHVAQLVAGHVQFITFTINTRHVTRHTIFAGQGVIMSAIYLLIPLSLLFLGLAIWAFLWAAKSRQFDDLDTPAVSILMDEQQPDKPSSDD